MYGTAFSFRRYLSYFLCLSHLINIINIPTRWRGILKSAPSDILQSICQGAGRRSSGESLETRSLSRTFGIFHQDPQIILWEINKNYNLMDSSLPWLILHPSNKCCGNLSCTFCIILRTNKHKRRWKHNPLGVGYANKCCSINYNIEMNEHLPFKCTQPAFPVHILCSLSFWDGIMYVFFPFLADNACDGYFS